MEKKKKRSMLTVDLFREIRHSMERFLSIFAIVAIGVAFFAGIRATSSVMKTSADTYFDETNLMDYYIMCNFGLVDDDVEAIRNIEGVTGVFATNTTTVVTSKDKAEYVMIVHGLDINHIDPDHPDYINQYELIEGRWPQKSGECLIEDGKIYTSNLEIGDTIVLDSGTSDDIKETLITDTYTIVGVVRTSFYLSYEKGTTNIKDGDIDSFLIIPNDDFILDYYSVLYLTVDHAKEYNSYDDEYFDLISDVGDRLASVGVIQAEKRYQDIIIEATEKLTDARKEYEEGLEEFNTEIEKAEKELDDADRKILMAEMTLQNNKDLAELRFELAQQEIDSGKEQLKMLKDYYAQLEEEFNEENEYLIQQEEDLTEELDIKKEEQRNKQTAYNQADAEYERIKALKDESDALKSRKLQLENDIHALDIQINTIQAEINGGNTDPDKLNELNRLITEKNNKESELNTVEQQITNFNQNHPDIDIQLADASTTRSLAATELTLINNEVTDLQRQLDAVQRTLSASRAGLDTLQEQITTTEKEIADGEKQLNDGRATAQKEFIKAEKEIEDAKEEYIEGKTEFLLEKAKAEAELLDAEEKIIKAEKDVEAIEEGEWYILDRNAHYSYRDYGGAADRMDRIASVFPLFFFLVAALVCSTTMTRMIDEQRSSIGTLKALGYGNIAIFGKYLRYSFLASICGCIVGISLGMYIFPTVIFVVWNTMYTVRRIVYVPKVFLMILTSVIAILITSLASYSSCYFILKEVPSSLLRPKAPIIGKKIILERISFIWKKFSFTSKITARNIFRYKKRFFMTVIGISGCTALLLAGFGIRDSIGQIALYQFEEIINYDATASFDTELTADEKDEFVISLKKDQRVDDAMIISRTNGSIYTQNEELSVSIYVPEDLELFKEYYTLRNRSTKEVLNLKVNGIILSEKAAKDLDLEVDDKVTISNDLGYKEQAEIIGIAENYVGHYVYMSSFYYKSLFDIRPVYNTALIKLNDTSDQIQSAFGNDIMKGEEITSVTFYSGMAQSFIDMISSIDLVVIVMIISAGLLAFVVLYNLSNVNISERMREIATLKVLGFTDKEVSSYVYREIVILTFVGSLAGLILGIYLHRFIMSIAELDDVMFGREIYPISFALSIIITLIFSVIVHFAMRKKLKQIQMIESLKSVE